MKLDAHTQYIYSSKDSFLITWFKKIIRLAKALHSSIWSI